MPNAKIKSIQYASHFLKSFQRLPRSIQRLSEEKEKWFCDNPFDQRLRVHKLKGELSDKWAYSVNYSYRILFSFISSEEVIYYDIGTHEIYK